MGNNTAGKESKLSKYIKTPIRILAKIRDFYIKGMTECSGRFDYGTGTALGCPTTHISTLPKSFSTSSARSSNNNEDFQDLVRVASTRSLGNKVQQQAVVAKSPTTTAPDNMPRSRSVGFGRIDEDKPCEFEEVIKLDAKVYPRSRSYAVSS
ncbi:hypothetical protein I3760_01G002600 [Carya illinoinensis]|uniref:Uncharacterized protein n=1 Tax=Carya illinoinensis TaxID=32201 RepID=A0A8T1RGE0_CARIL|nr:uncharacterized protein LOC122301413 [Carya illinoinensis]KAG2724105.1 hypothetical protein I3760_01G002600 [Carya illinoinensis]KAG6666037.1 hypothetical protein CIPAW_01G002900 [Carya illinoinensis]